MKHLTFLLFWLSVLLLGSPAQAADPLDSSFNSAQPLAAQTTIAEAKQTAQTNLLYIPDPNAPVGASDKTNDLPPPPDNPTEPPIAPTPIPPTPSTSPKPKPIALTFTLPAPLAAASASSPSSPPASPPPRSPASLAAASLDSLFAGDSNSLVAKAVGAAEGTRTPDGNRNPAYYGHVDPG
ncbi:MAG TPA: hypothetical protein V6D10_20520, partial [Trichocoleus sp.]